MPFASSHGAAEIHYETHGIGEIPLVFLHGWGGSLRTWEKVMPNLETARFRAICVDLRGHGQSGRTSNGYTWADFEQDVLAVADREQVSRFLPIGFSMGGKLACHLAARHPDRIAAQILVAPAGPGVVRIERELASQACREANDPSKARGFFGNWFSSKTPSTIVDAGCEVIAATPQAVLEATLEMTLWTSIEKVVGRLQLPTLLVLGKSDPVYGEAYQRENMLPFLSKVQTVSVSSGHFIPLECPAELARLITARVPRLAGGDC